MDERLSRSNRLPGSEKLTRPEEIGQLSKYLKSIKEVYEESTRLEDQVLGVSGSRTGKIPEIDSLEKKSVKAPENQGEDVDLSQKILGVPGKKLEDKLEGKRINLFDSRQTELDDSLIKTPDNHGGEVDHLGEVIKKIQDVRDQRLGNKRIDLLDERLVALEDTRLDLQAMINASLENKRINLEDNRGIKLEDTILNLEDSRTAELENKRLDLEDERALNLSDKILELEEPKEIGLTDKRLDIQDERENSLENKRIDLSAEEDIELGDKRIDLEEPKEPELEDTRVDLEDNRETKLGDTRINLFDNRQTELNNTRLDLKDERETKLNDTRLGLTDSRQEKLADKRLDLKDDREIVLGDKKIELEDDRFVKLGDKKVEIRTTLSEKIVGLDGTGSEPTELETTRLDLSDNRDTKLGDTRIDLEDSRNIGLTDKKVELIDDKEVTLSDKKIGLNDDNEPELGETRINLKDDRDIGLEDKRLDISDSRDTELSEIRLDLKDDRETELWDKKIGLVDEREAELKDKILKLTDDRDTKLGDKRLDLKDDRESELSSKKIELEDNRETNLSDKILELKDDRETELENTRLDLSDERESFLSDKILSLLDERKTELEDKRLDLEDERENELEDFRLDLKDEREGELEDKLVKVLENENGEPEELYDSLLELPENENGKPEELYDAFLGMAENQGGEVTELENKRLDLDDQRDTSLSDRILGITENQGTAPDITDINVESIRDYTAKLSDAELYEFAMKIASEGDKASGEHDGWLEKVSGLMSAYLSSDILTPKRAIEFRDAINNTLEMSYFGSQAALRVPVDTSSGTTWAKAEESVGEQITGTNRRDALDEMIVKLVDYKKSNLPRLPGSDLVDAAKGAIKNVVGVVTGSTSHPNPMNKPLHLNGMAIPGGYGDTLYQAANNRTNFNTINEVGDIIGTVFYDRYWSAKSFKTTLEDLCPIVGKAPIASLTELKAILKSSPYFTSPGKFMTDAKGSYNTFSLDTNMYWEVTIEPFCSDSDPCSNGGFSFLPAIQEINYLNKEIHGVSTNYGYWAPISGFELQKSKLSTKSLQLYEGEISYPTGMEFTNELRLTFVDDAWKSWKRYFERCADVAVYNSVAHPISTYTGASGVTRIDKNHICIASYKNLAFNIKIYILNPQLNLINRFNLLCVLKDYAEEYVGEIDSGGTDLNVTFSIVGENPEENKTKKFEAAAEAIVNLAQQALLQAQKRITGAINSSVGLL